ncbi:hypothetical protein DFH09DRAFT_1294676 [Mycena vulgaris]|nr:hypothetical protein DFH09DRAFT_1294676 [Mycena vulgaris]
MTQVLVAHSMVPPPLIGDVNGKYRVHIVGNSGKHLAELLGVPFISLDTLFWKPGWKKSSTDESREKVLEALASAPNGWVVDGNYSARVGSIVQDSSTDVIWLDPPLILYLPRIIIRTVLRLLRLRAPCSPGCPEMLSEVLFSKESIIWWCITQHGPVRKREGARMSEIGIGVGTVIEGQKMRRIGGWGGELREWFAEVKRMLQRR